MKALVLWADPTASNFGLRVIADGAELLARSVGAERVDFYNFGIAGPSVFITRKRLAVELVRGGPITEWLREFDLILDTGLGDSFTDAYGMHRLQHIVLMRMLSSRVSRVALTPQTIGPFNTLAGRILAKAGTSSKILVMARDNVSAAYYEKLTGREAVCASDLVFGLSADRQPVSSSVAVNISGLLWYPNRHVDFGVYREAVVGLLSSLQDRGVKVSIVPHVLAPDSADSDINSSRDAAGLTGTRVEVRTPASLADARNILGSQTAVIGSRMHACLNALSMGTPSLSWTYSRKFAPLMADLSWPHYMAVAEPRAMVAAGLEFVANSSNLRIGADRSREAGREKFTVAVHALAEWLAR